MSQMRCSLVSPHALKLTQDYCLCRQNGVHPLKEHRFKTFHLLVSLFRPRGNNHLLHTVYVFSLRVLCLMQHQLWRLGLGSMVVNTVTSQQEGTNPQQEFKSSGLSVQFLSGDSGFLRQSKDTHVRLNGDSK